LGFGREIADLVEENRSSVSRLKTSHALLYRSGEANGHIDDLPEMFFELLPTKHAVSMGRVLR